MSTTLPIRATCTGCHDSAAAAGHIELQTAPGGLETCDVCHGAGRDFSVAGSHAP